jgi:hypothetical protein
MPMKKSIDTIGNRTPHLSVCSAVPQPTAPPPPHSTASNSCVYTDTSCRRRNERRTSEVTWYLWGNQGRKYLEIVPQMLSGIVIDTSYGWIHIRLLALFSKAIGHSVVPFHCILYHQASWQKTENSLGLQAYDAVSLVELFQTFPRNVMSSQSRMPSSWTTWRFKTKALRSFAALGTTHPATQRHILNDLIPQQHRCENAKSCRLRKDCINRWD